MKIDEKVVCYFESCKSPVDKEGYLSKKGEIKTSYQKRWFMLKANLLFYKDRPGDKDLIGVIVLEGCTVQLCESEEQFAFSLVWSEPGLRTYKFAAEDQASQESWIKALLSASHSYLALLVMDMEKQYKDALRAHPSESRRPFTMPTFPSTHASTLPAFAAQSVGRPASQGSSQQLQAPNSSVARAVSKKSPKLWPKRNSNMVAVGAPALPMLEFSGLCFAPEEQFIKLHEDFGREIKKLIADWSRRRGGGEDLPVESLIDFG
uniref:Sesquipedalian n=1 Tax=Fundulus heteroclitus TaxID=8078 RepID=A0A3Q2QHE7_FUNHE